MVFSFSTLTKAPLQPRHLLELKILFSPLKRVPFGHTSIFWEGGVPSNLSCTLRYHQLKQLKTSNKKQYFYTDQTWRAWSSCGSGGLEWWLHCSLLTPGGWLCGRLCRYKLFNQLFDLLLLYIFHVSKSFQVSGSFNLLCCGSCSLLQVVEKSRYTKLERGGPGRGKGGREGRGEKRERGIEGSKVTVLQFKRKHPPSVGVISTLVGGENFADHMS